MGRSGKWGARGSGVKGEVGSSGKWGDRGSGELGEVGSSYWELRGAAGDRHIDVCRTVG